MTYVITAPCIDVKDGDCVNACPVDCIYEGDRMFYIQPDECIECGLCESICPVAAIYPDDELPADMTVFTTVNAEFFSDRVSGLGSPGGALGKTAPEADHPTVAAHPRQRRNDRGDGVVAA
jgi:ferredoxin